MQRLKETLSKRSKDLQVTVIFSGVPSNFKAKDRPCTDHVFYSIDDSTLQFKVGLILANPLVSYFYTKTVNLVRVSLRFIRVILCAAFLGSEDLICYDIIHDKYYQHCGVQKKQLYCQCQASLLSLLKDYCHNNKSIDSLVLQRKTKNMQKEKQRKRRRYN